MKKLHQILILAMSFAAWSVGAAAQERTVEIVKDGQVVFSVPAREIEYMTVVVPHVPEYVDLGLPSGLKWATCNVGASSPSDYGNYYAWGETRPKTEYTESTSVTYNKKLDDISGNPQYDAARANWGGSWRLPTRTECRELLNKCTWTWMSQGGHNGYKVTGPNGNSIFLPAAGYRVGVALLHAESYGDYWSSTTYASSTQYACSLYFGSDYHNEAWSSRYYGRVVRPVSY